jgi:hypothetical protein
MSHLLELLAGQLGNGQNVDAATPQNVLGLTGATSVAAGVYHTCATLAAGSVHCWGWNGGGQLGADPGLTASSRTPLQVSGLTGAVSVSAGFRQSCAVLQDGTARCWGGNTYGASTTSTHGKVKLGCDRIAHALHPFWGVDVAVVLHVGLALCALDKFVLQANPILSHCAQALLWHSVMQLAAAAQHCMTVAHHNHVACRCTR